MKIVISLLLSATLAQAGVRDGYRSPALVVPYAQTKPTIDGKIEDAEWQDAASFTGLQTTAGKVSTRQTQFWIKWDADNLYLAMRSPLRAGERVVQALRDRTRKDNVVFDDSYEIWLDAGTKSPDGQPCFFQFLANFTGARYDVLHEPAVGNSRVGWTSGWEPVNRLTPDGKAWEWEMAIPRASLYRSEPFRDGVKLRALFARNYKRPWEQNSFEGTAAFNVADSYTLLTLSKSAPAVHLLSVGDPSAGTLGLNASATGPVHWTFASDSGVTKADTFAPNLDTLGTGHYRIRATTADGRQTLLDWCAQRQFGDQTALTQKLNDTGDQVSLKVTFNPAGNYVRATGDFINYDNRAAIRDCQLTVGGQSQTFPIDNLAYARGTLRLGDVTNGEYTAKLICRNAAGQTLVERETKFTKQDPTQFPWWKTKRGNIEKVIAPWTPVTYHAGEFGVWGRQMKLGTAGLPAQITSQGQPLLAAPMRLETARAATAGKLAVTAQADHRAVVAATGKLGDLDLQSRVTVEFDGMYKVELTITPKKPVALDTLKLVVPIRPEVAELLHASGQGIRYGFDVKLLEKGAKGRLWDSRRIDGQGMAVGSFIPFIWLGNARGGLCWFADSDQGWLPNNEVPAIEVRRDQNASVDLVLNLISVPATLDAPRTITFAFQATPVKPLPDGWRLDSWWCGDTFKDYQGVEKRGGQLIWTNIPFPLDPDSCRQLVDGQHRGNAGYNLGVTRGRANAVPYLEWNHIAAQYAPEVSYFGEQWQASGTDGGLCFDDTLIDYLVDKIGNWCEQTGIDGVYIDNVRPVTCANIDAGRGYRLPDGRIQPTFQIFNTRRLFLRLRAAFAEGGKAGKFVLHMTNHMIIPWIGAADMAYDGEHNVIFPESGKDFMDLWTPERLRLDYPGQWGVPVNFMHEYQGNWPKDRYAAAMRAYTGMILLQDALPSGNANGLNKAAWQARDKFGIDANDVRFFENGDPTTGLRCDTKGIFVAGWQRPGKLLIAVVNTGEVAVAKLQLTKLSAAKITDAESNAVLTNLDIPIGRHDYRQILIETK